MKDLIEISRQEKGLYWNDAWNIVEGCAPVSRGCMHCWKAEQTYMRSHQQKTKIKERYSGLTMRVTPCFNGHMKLMYDDLGKPFDIKKPTVFLVLNDLFFERVPAHFIRQAFDVMGSCYQHYFIVLTKRPERMREYLRRHVWENGETWWETQPPNIILGTSVEDQSKANERIPLLKSIPAVNRVVSFEPILEYIHLRPEWFSPQGCPECSHHDMLCPHCHKVNNDGIEWAIIGVETGKKRRSCDIKNVKMLAVTLKNIGFGMPVFIKAVELNGKVVKDMGKFPIELQLREFPNTEMEKIYVPQWKKRRIAWS